MFSFALVCQNTFLASRLCGFRAAATAFSMLIGWPLALQAQAPCPGVTVTTTPTGPRTLCAGGSVSLTASATGPGFDLGGSGVNGSVHAVARQADGKVLLGGSFDAFDLDFSAPNGILRLNADGTLDKTFNYVAGSNTTGIQLGSTTEAIVVQPDGKIIIGGQNGGYTSYNGNPAAPDYIVRLNADGSLDPTFNAGGTGAGGGVYDLVLQPDGKILVGGDFGSYNGNSLAPDGLLRLNANGSLDQTFNYGSNTNGLGGVRALALQPDGRIVVGGISGATYNGDPAAPNSVLRVNANGSLDQTFNYFAGSTTTGTDGYVYGLAVRPNGKIVICGSFLAYNGDVGMPNHLAQLNPDGSLDTSFNYLAGNNATGLSYPVLALGLQADGKVVIAGGGPNYGELGVFAYDAPNSLMRINANGSLDRTFNYVAGSLTMGLSGGGYSVLVQPDGRILVGGASNHFNQNTLIPLGIARFNPDGSLSPLGDPITTATYTWNTGTTGPNLTVTQPGTYVPRTTNGGCTSYGNAVTVAAAPAATVTITPSGPTTVPAGGSVTLTATATLAGFNVGGSGFVANGVAAVVAQPDGKVLVGGNFTAYNGNAAAPDYLVRLNADGSLDPTFNAGGAGFDSDVRCLALLPDGKMLVGGAFVSYNGNAAASDYLLRLNPDGSLDNTFTAPAPSLGGTVVALAVQADGRVLAAGSGTTVTGGANRVLARLNTDGSLDAGFNPGGVGFVSVVRGVLVQADGKILVGGTFTTYNGNAAASDRLARLYPDGSLDAEFNPGGTGFAGNGGAVNTLALQPDGRILVGGDFSAYNGNFNVPDNLLRLDRDGRWDNSFNGSGAGTDANTGQVLALSRQPDGNVLVGGNFTAYNGVASAPDRVLRVTAQGAIDNAFNPGGYGGVGGPSVSSLALLADGKVVVGGTFTGYNGNAAAPDGLLRLSATGALDNATSALPGATFAWNPGPTTGPTRTASASGSYTATATSAQGCAFASAPVVVQVGPTATAPALNAATLGLYPNPAQRTATVRLPAVPGAAQATLTLTDALGRMVQARTLALPATGTRAELDLSALAPGVYALHVMAGGQAAVRRLVVE